MASTWRIRQFGAVALEGPGFEAEGATFATQRSAKLLTLLALVRHGKMRREDLADALWPDDFFDATRLRLRKEVSRLRQSLGAAAAALQSDGESIVLDRTAFETDVEILRRAASIPEGDPRREAGLREAARAVEGSFLPEWNDPWVVAERHAAESLKGRVLAALGDVLLARGDVEGSLRTVRTVIERDPCHEAARMVAIRAHAALGSLADAVAEFQGMKRSMRERNDGAPSPDAETLFERVQRGESAPEGSSQAARLPALSASVDRFFGRREEMAALTEALSPDGPDRLVSLVGAGGMGKTRLANEAALALRDVYGGNVAFVSLAESPSPEAAAATLLAHLGWQGTAAADPAAVVAASLPAGPCLFVLDNLEHLLPEAADLVKRLLAACPSLRVLATSRQSLRLAGERIVALGPLGEAAEMLADLARSMRPGLADDPDLAELARRLDGIPLALRLAAPRLRVLKPSDILARLDDRFRLLRSDAPDLPERHRSLHAALDGSFEGLGERERRALAAVAPFRGGWTLAHLDRVLPDDDGLAAMEALVDASLVALDDHGPSVRFTMLETVREYVSEGGDVAEAERAFVRTMAEELRRWLPRPLSPRTWAALAALDAEADNLHVAAEAAIRRDPDVADDILSRLWSYDIGRARQRDLQRLYRDFALAWPDHRPSGWAAFGEAAGFYAAQTLERSEAAARRAERAFLESGDPGAAACAAAHALVTLRRRRVHSAAQSADLHPPLVERAATDPETLIRLLFYQGDANYYAKRLETAADCLDRATSLARASGDQVNLITAVQQRTIIALDLGEFEAVGRALAEVAEAVVRLGDPVRLANHDELSGMAARGRGDDAGALAFFRRCGEVWRRLGNLYQVGELANASARALARLGRSEEARAAAREAFGAYREIDQLVGVAASLATLAEARLIAGEPDHAATAFAAARRLVRDHGLEFAQSEGEYVQSVAARLPDLPDAAVGDLGSLFD